jgi:Protein of unknown function (DUF4236)
LAPGGTARAVDGTLARAEHLTMGFRFHRRLRLFPGVRLNFSKSGVSTSIGRRGAWLTLGKRRARVTVGLPGSGLSYTSTSSSHHADPTASVVPPAPESRADMVRIVLWLTLLAVAAWSIIKLRGAV